MTGEERTALLIGQKQCEQLTQGDWLCSGCNSRHHRIVLDVEAGEDVGGNFFIFKFLPSRCHGICQGLHLGEVFRDGGGALLRSGQSNPSVDDLARDWDANIPSMASHMAAAVESA